MNEQEKALQGMIEFCQWLIPNAKQLGLEKSQSIAMISQAQSPEDIVKGIEGLYKELGEEQFTALTQAFQQSKQQAIKMAKHGAKLDNLVKKFQSGGSYEDWFPKDGGRLLKVRPKQMFGTQRRIFNAAPYNQRHVKTEDGYFSYTIEPNRDTIYYYNPGGPSTYLDNELPKYQEYVFFPDNTFEYKWTPDGSAHGASRIDAGYKQKMSNEGLKAVLEKARKYLK